MKTALTLLALTAGASAGVAHWTADGLRTDYAKERGLRVARSLSTTSELVDFTMVVDGEERDGPGGSRSSSSTRRVVTVDKVESHADGDPTRVKRTYEALGVEGSSSFGDQSRDFERTSPMEGAELAVYLDEDGELKVEILDGDPSAASLEGQHLELELDHLLPDGDVEAGATWDLEPAAIARALMLGREEALFPREEREAPEGGEGRGGRGRGMRGGMGGGGLNDAGLAGLEWEGEATLSEETREHQGLTCRVIELELEARGELPEPEWGGGRGRDRAAGLPSDAAGALRGTTVELDLEGVLLFSVDEGRPVHLMLEGDYTLEMQRTMDRGERSMEMSSTTEGEWKYEVEVTLAD